MFFFILLSCTSSTRCFWILMSSGFLSSVVCTIWVLDCCPNTFLWWGLLLPISDSCKSSLICLEHSRTTWSASASRGILSFFVVMGFAAANFRILQVQFNMPVMSLNYSISLCRLCYFFIRSLSVRIVVLLLSSTCLVFFFWFHVHLLPFLRCWCPYYLAFADCLSGKSSILFCICFFFSVLWELYS
jgi:hypothetical protein